MTHPYRYGNQMPVFRHECAQMSWTEGGGHAAATETITNFNGRLRQYIVTLSDANDPITATVTITMDGATFDTASALAENAVTLVDANDSWLAGSVVVSVDPNAEPNSAFTADVILLGD